MVLAEKIVTAIDRGEANTRWRDFADIYTLSRVSQVDGGVLRASLETVAAYRRVELAPLIPRFAEMPERVQPKWRAWRVRVNRDRELPEQFADVLDVVAEFADPILNMAASGEWNARTARWTSNG
ncbi:nucleotidyl transferase AbiEii/AbiGii toxin family protein [Agromyces bauzanensis]|uniref:Uncharacterized protein n=1 Tax=Agromyces bauzanensis TaxID=1308924 RepID=A0A917PBJ4_9MICO|nr:nucleotidyl transferase AbiEii/AbiGii toxin family protein [Agromyces bauzanensis]GGJ69741.1 hypothetical protein GCM10011372_04450 [Agromyces bauzanensis]